MSATHDAEPAVPSGAAGSVRPGPGRAPGTGEARRGGVECVLVAAGAGTRLAAGRPKAFVPVAGRPLLVHAAEGLAASGAVDALVVVVPAGAERATAELLVPVAGLPPATVVAGGASRQASVAAGLAALPAGTDVVLVHDAARALTPPAVVRRVVEAVAAGHGAVVPAVPVVDTLREVGGGVVDRARLRAVQTPQGFDAATLRRAHAVPADGEGATDDAGLVERTGVPVHVVAGDPEALKVTTPLDLLLVEALLARRGAARTAAVVGTR